MLELTVEGSGNITKDLAIDRHGAAKIALRTDQRARSEGLIDGSGGWQISEDYVALILGQHAVAFGMEVEGRSAGLVDHQPGDVANAADIASFRRGGPGDLNGGRPKAVAKHDVHDLLIGAIPIFECDFLGQDLDPADRFG